MLRPVKLSQDEGVQKLQTTQDYYNPILNFAYHYLQEKGYFNGHPSDTEGYTPWYNFPAIKFTKDILKPEHKVLEYGAGYSTLFYRDRVSELYTVEHNEEWAAKVTEIDPNMVINIVPKFSNYKPEAQELLDEFIRMELPLPCSTDEKHDEIHGLLNSEFVGYASMIFDKPKGYFDIVVIDGMARVLTGFFAANMIKDDGYIILDNSDRWVYNPLQKYLIEKGFGRVDIWGPGHGSNREWCTSFYSKRFNFVPNQIERPVDDRLIEV